MKTHRVSKSTNFLTKKYPSTQYINKHLYQFIKFTQAKFTGIYCHQENVYYISLINDLIIKDNTHNVAQYKDYLLYEDLGDYLHTYYQRSDSQINLPQIFDYYQSSSVIFPNYVALPESKYIYKNIQRKQKIIDLQQQQQLEYEERKEDCPKNNTRARPEIRYRNGHANYQGREIDTLSNETYNDKIFDTEIFDSLLNQTDTSIIQQLFGIQYDQSNQSIMNTIVCSNNNTIEKLPQSKHDKSINGLIDIIDQCEKNSKVDTEHPINCSLKKYTASMKTKYINCTTTTKDTKDKSNSISNITCRRKVIISNVLSLGKEIKFRPFQATNTNQFKSAKGLYNEISHNASSSYNINNNKDKEKDKLHISSSSTKNRLIINHKKQEKIIARHVKNALSMPKMANNNTIINQPKTTRESNGNNDLIQLLTDKMIRMKSLTKLISQQDKEKSNSKKHYKSKQLKQTPSKKFVNCLSINSSSSIYQKINKQKNQHKDLLKKALQSKNINANVITSYCSNKNNNLYISNTIRNTSNRHSICNSNNNCYSSSKMTNKINERQITISPVKENNSNSRLIIKTCTNFPMKNLYNDEKNKKKLHNNNTTKQLQNNAIFQRKDSEVQGFEIKGFERLVNSGRTITNSKNEHYSDRTLSRNNKNNDTDNKIKKAFQKIICKKID